MNHNSKTEKKESAARGNTAGYHPDVDAPDAEREYEKLRAEIMSQVFRAVGGVMRGARKPALVWAVLEGVFVDGRTVADVCAEHGERRQTGSEILSRFKKGAGLDK